MERKSAVPSFPGRFVLIALVVVLAIFVIAVVGFGVVQSFGQSKSVSKTTTGLAPTAVPTTAASPTPPPLTAQEYRDKAVADMTNRAQVRVVYMQGAALDPNTFMVSGGRQTDDKTYSGGMIASSFSFGAEKNGAQFQIASENAPCGVGEGGTGAICVVLKIDSGSIHALNWVDKTTFFWYHQKATFDGRPIEAAPDRFYFPVS